MPSTQSLYVKQPIPPEELPHLGEKWLFVGIDLAPVETLETGVAVLDRDRMLTRMDKIYSNEDILRFLKSLGPAQNLIVALDVPKSLSIPGRWRQEEIKMHPLRLERKGLPQEDEAAMTDRYAQRVKDLYALVQTEGVLPFLYFSYLAKMKYDLTIPYRTRTPAGCRALQAIIKSRLQIPNVPTNLAPSSVLDAMIGAYTAWSFYRGKAGMHYTLFRDEGQRYHLEPLSRLNARR